MTLDLTKKSVRLTWSAVMAALGIAAGSGGTVAIANGKIETTQAKTSEHTEQIKALEREAQLTRERLVRIETNTEQTTKVLERLEKKLDRQP